MKIKKKILSLALAGTMALGLMPGMTMTALADGDTSYTLTIPSTLTVADKGWNATDGISATGTLATGKKLTVTAESTNGWKLVSGSNNVGYTLTTASGGNQTTSWEFTTLDGTAQPMGIIVENYDGKPAGTYTDTVTFTASVVSATKKLTFTGQYFDYDTGKSVPYSVDVEYTDDDTWGDLVNKYDWIITDDYINAPDGKIVKIASVGDYGGEVKSRESTHNYGLVSINDKVSAYSVGSYFLEVN